MNADEPSKLSVDGTNEISPLYNNIYQLYWLRINIDLCLLLLCHAVRSVY